MLSDEMKAHHSEALEVKKDPDLVFSPEELPGGCVENSMKVAEGSESPMEREKEEIEYSSQFEVPLFIAVKQEPNVSEENSEYLVGSTTQNSHVQEEDKYAVGETHHMGNPVSLGDPEELTSSEELEQKGYGHSLMTHFLLGCSAEGEVTHSDDNFKYNIGAHEEVGASCKWRPSLQDKFLDEQDGKRSGKGTFDCQNCGKQFADSAHLEVHKRIHTNTKPFLCPLCKKAFRQFVHLKIHMRVHSGDRPYKCSACDRSFKTSGDLERHAWIHSGEKPFKCPECGKAFTRNYACKAHMRSHSVCMAMATAPAKNK